MSTRSFAFVALALVCLASGACSDDSPAPAMNIGQLPQLRPGLHRLTATLDTGETLRYTLSIPAGFDATRPAPLVVVLHYGGKVEPFYGEGAIEALAVPALDELRAVIVAPDSLGGDWTSAANERAVVWLTRSAIQSYGLDSKRVLLTGFSMGGAGTWHIGARHQDLFTAAMPVASSPASGPEWRIPVCAIHSRQDEVLPFAPVEARTAELRAGGVNVHFIEATGLTHFDTGQYAGFIQQSIPWLNQAWK